MTSLKTPLIFLQRRGFSTGTRGARGHGWLTNYREGKGGRHLQGEYFDRSQSDALAWNRAVLELGSKRVHMKVVAEPKSNTEQTASLDNLTGAAFELEMDVASAVFPETVENFVQLLQEKYRGTRLYRVERNVGLYGGDVVTNTGKAGHAAGEFPRLAPTQDLSSALWHVPGTLSMVVPTVGEIDSRFLLCSHYAPHLDGIHRAFGMLTDDSLALVKEWHDTLWTTYGVPAGFDLILTEGSVVDESPSSSSQAA
jgi:cyclophilin family peptidyl-prolyl cis-trans isomerase